MVSSVLLENDEATAAEDLGCSAEAFVDAFHGGQKFGGIKRAFAESTGKQITECSEGVGPHNCPSAKPLRRAIVEEEARRIALRGVTGTRAWK